MADIIAESAAFTAEADDGIATLRYRKGFLDVAIDLHTRDQLLALLDRLEGDHGILGLIQINDEQFSGSDKVSALMKELVAKGSGGLATLQRFKRSFFQIVSRGIEFGKPVVSGVIGEMSMDELGVSLICDRVLISDDCVVRNVTASAGLPAGPPLTFILPHIVGPKRAVTLLTDDGPLAASDALDLGLVDGVVPRANLEEGCREALRSLSQLPSPVVSATRDLVFSQYAAFEDHVDRYIRTAVQILHAHNR